jgi:predicted transposase YdaD
MMLTTFEKGVAKRREEGRQEGRQEGLREAARIQLEQRFGPLSDAVLARLASWPAERLHELLATVLKAQSLQQLGLEDADKH